MSEVAEDPDPPAVDSTESPRADTDWDRRDWWAVAALFAVSIVLVSLHVRAYPTLSPIDELAHVDYVLKAGDFDIPPVGDTIGVEAMSEAACRTLDVFEYRGPPCGRSDYTPDDFGERVFATGAVNDSASQFPAYYTVTGVLSRVTADLGLVESQVTAARFVGALWAGAGWSVIWAVLGVLRIPRARRALAMSIVIATPLTLFHSATVNADAVLVLTGATAVFATLRFQQQRLHGGWLLVCFSALMFVEPTNALAIGACCGLLILRTSWSSSRSTFDRAVPLIALVLAALHRQRVGPWVRDRIALGSPSPEFASAGEPLSERPGAAPRTELVSLGDAVDFDDVVRQLTALLTPIQRAYVPPFLRSEHTYQLIELANWILGAGMFVAATGLTMAVRKREVVAEREDGAEDVIANTLWLSRFGLLSLLLAGPIYTLSFGVFSDILFEAPGRFGLPLVVFLVIGLATALTTRSASLIVGAVATASALNLSWLLLTP